METCAEFIFRLCKALIMATQVFFCDSTLYAAFWHSRILFIGIRNMMNPEPLTLIQVSSALTSSSCHLNALIDTCLFIAVIHLLPKLRKQKNKTTNKENSLSQSVSVRAAAKRLCDCRVADTPV